jgi:hypothetical protein
VDVVPRSTWDHVHNCVSASVYWEDLPEAVGLYPDCPARTSGGHLTLTWCLSAESEAPFGRYFPLKVQLPAADLTGTLICIKFTVMWGCRSRGS